MYPMYPMYPWMFPMLPNNCEKPPTLYAILNSIVNYGKEEQTKIKDLAKEGRTTIFDFDYPLSDKLNREDFEILILNKFMMRRIGFDTVTAFKLQLNVKLNEIMPIYNKMFDALDGWNIFDGETTTRDRNVDFESDSTNEIQTNDKSNGVSTSDRRSSDLPQNEIDNIKDGNYMTNYEYDTDTNNLENNGTSNSKMNTKDGTIEKETITKTVPDRIKIYKEFLDTKNNIYSMIFTELEELFYGLI